MSTTITRDVGGWLLEKDGTQLSYLSVDMTDLCRFPYVDTIGGLIDRMAEGPLRVLHIGGGAMTLARYISAVRPGSSHIVAEPDAELLYLVSAQLPWPRDFRIVPIVNDGLSVLTRQSDMSRDLIIMDAFVGFDTPQSLRTEEAFVHAERVLKPGGLLMANVITEAESFIETMGSVFGAVMTIEIEGSPYSNTVAVAGREK